MTTAAFENADLFPIHTEAFKRTVLDVNFGADLSDEEREFLLPLDPDLHERAGPPLLQSVVYLCERTFPDIAGTRLRSLPARARVRKRNRCARGGDGASARRAGRRAPAVPPPS